MTPCVRGLIVRQNLAWLVDDAGGEVDEILAQLPSGLVDDVRDAGMFDWLPLGYDVELCHASVALIGAEADRARARTVLGRTLSSPLLRPFVVAAEALFGLDPSAALRQVPRGWYAIYRDAGRVRYVVDAGCQRRLIYEEVPKLVLDSRVYQAAIAGAIESLLDLCKAEGEVELREADHERREVELIVRWF